LAAHKGKKVGGPRPASPIASAAYGWILFATPCIKVLRIKKNVYYIYVLRQSAARAWGGSPMGREAPGTYPSAIVP